ncbi:NADPH-dependent FMN reductase [Frankia tisae]|uniref:NADPH-dependent FMN reductase n=1 Tax=Frankia tisae TaxID=2950104 RepID=UPI0021BE1A21|nr:hypothetical protein [Frankia tisae]
MTGYPEWQAKVIGFVGFVGFVGYSGASGSLPAIKYLRQVFAELHASTMRDHVSFPRYYKLFTPDGALRDPDGPADAAATLLDQLDIPDG